MPPIVLSLGLQFLVGIFFWRATVRKTANPFQPLLLRWEAIAIFALLVVVQQGLIWGIWHGHFRKSGCPQPQLMVRTFALHCARRNHPRGCFNSRLGQPRARTRAGGGIAGGLGNLRLVFSRSAVWLAVALSGIAAVASATQFIFSFTAHGAAWALAAANLLAFLLMFSLLLEFCRLRFQRRALGFVALWLFVFCLLPFILAGVFSNEGFAKLSFLAPGTIALAGAEIDDLKFLVGCTFAHLGVVVLLFIAWQRQWKLLLAPPAPVPPAK